jgi:hypothetical protein
MTRPTRIDLLLVVALVSIGSAITILWGERIGIRNGEGWDGAAYSAWARAFPDKVLDEGVNRFQARRVLPSALVHYGLGALDMKRAGANIQLAFQVLNALALLASAVLLHRIAVLLAWSRSATWLAFTATFLGFANARGALYYPAETDPTAFALAMAVVWAYVGRRPIALALSVLAGAFTWPALLALGFALLVLPTPAEPLPATTGPWHRRLAIAVAAATAAFIIVWFAYSLANPIARGGWSGAPSFLKYSHRELWEVAIAWLVLVSAAAAYLVARDDRTWSVAPYLRGVGWRRIALGAAAAAAIAAISWAWANRVGKKGPGFSLADLRNYYAANAVRGPLWSTVHQVVYFGPIVLIAIAAWRRVAAVASGWGPGAVLGLGLTVVFAVNADARHLIHLMPFVIAATVTATAAWWTPRRVIGFAVLALGWSKIWWRIGYEKIHVSREWPDLRFFMHHGPWASDETFLWHLGGVIVTAAALWLLLRPARRAT